MASLRRPQLDDLVVANTLFERLVSGQQSEMGETPPSYEVAAGSQHHHSHAPALLVTPASAS